MNIADSFHAITAKLEKARGASPIAAPTVTFLAASKGQTGFAIEQAIAAGMTIFGENRVQEAEDKWREIKEKHPNTHLHLIGPLQTNKVKQSLSLFEVIQTLDRPKLAEAIAREIGKSGRREDENKKPFPASRLPDFQTSFYIQVNIGKEPQKAGVAVEEADDFIHYCKKLGLPVVGLMCVPPADLPPAPFFALLREIALRNGLTQLSMGMSEDYETAVRMGSSCVRIGRALFGEHI